MSFTPKDRYGMQDLLDIVRILREPGGCPWDREQTHASIRPNLIEETYEVADAIDRGDAGLLCEELGDLLLQIALHTRMEEEAGVFTFYDVCDGICKKLIFRHPHVFAGVEVSGSEQVLRNWDALKNEEKGRTGAAERLDSVPRTLPALMRSEKLQKRANAFGFSYHAPADAMDDLESEVAELRQALDESGAAATHEIGDVLFSAVNVARLVGADAEEALSRSAERFATRVKAVEHLAAVQGKDLKQLSASELDAFWRQAKEAENGHVPGQGM